MFVPPVTLETLLEAPETAEETAAEAEEAIEDTTPCEEDEAVEDAAAALLLIMLDSDSMLLMTEAEMEDAAAPVGKATLEVWVKIELGMIEETPETAPLGHRVACKLKAWACSSAVQLATRHC